MADRSSFALGAIPKPKNVVTGRRDMIQSFIALARSRCDRRAQKRATFAETQIPGGETVCPGGSFNRRMAMPASHNGEAAFDAEVTNAMGRAFEETCSALHIPFHDIGGRQAVASRIIDLARAGVTDAGALRDRVVTESHSKI